MCVCNSLVQDIDNEIYAVHTGWLGKKKKFRSKVWEILEQRFKENSLSTRKYAVSADIPESTDSPAAASSSSPAAAWLNATKEMPRSKEGEQMQEQSVGFPKQPAVEPCADDQGSDQRQENALIGWVIFRPRQGSVRL